MAADSPVEDSKQQSQPEGREEGPEDETLYREDPDDFLKLDNLPNEIFLHICQFLDARFVIKVMTRVCKQFHSIFNDDLYWKIRIGKRWPKKYPAVPVNDQEFDWKIACIDREEEYRLWTEPEKTMDYFSYTEGIFAPVDAVHLMQGAKLLATGSRDRYLNLLDVSQLDPENPASSKTAVVKSIINAHSGWIWTINSLGKEMVTGSWDSYIKFWDLEADCTEVRKVKAKSAILDTYYEPGLLVAGGYDKKVYHIDPRSCEIIDVKKYHQRPVLCLAVDDKFVVTGSEDKTVKVFDRRANKVFKTLEFEEYPMSLDYGQDQLWVGDKGGSLHLIDATDGDFNIVQSYPDVHKGKVTGVKRTHGAIYTCSTDKTINVLEPTVDPGVISVLTNQTSDVAGLSYQNETLACASSSANVGIWKAKRRDYERD